MKVECKAVHVVKARQTEAAKSMLGDVRLPQWLFGPCVGPFPSAEKMTKSKKMKVKKANAAESPKVDWISPTA